MFGPDGQKLVAKRQPLANTNWHDERRRGPRIPTDDIAYLRILKPASPERLVVRVLDVSKGGFKLGLGKSLYPGCEVQIRLKDVVALGEVRYCVPAKVGFFAGIQIQAVQEVLVRRTALAGVEGDREALAEVASVFFEQCPSLVSLIHKSIASGNAKALRFHAHTLKGSVGCFAAQDSAAAAAALEEMASKNDLSTAEDAFLRLREALGHLDHALRELLQDPGKVT